MGLEIILNTWYTRLYSTVISIIFGSIIATIAGGAQH